MARPVPGGVGGSKSNVSGSYGGKSLIESRDSASDSESGWDGDSCLGDYKTGELCNSARDARIPGQLTLLGVLSSETDGVSVAESRLQAVLTGCASLLSFNPTECAGLLAVLCLFSVNKLLPFLCNPFITPLLVPFPSWRWLSLLFQTEIGTGNTHSLRFTVHLFQLWLLLPLLFTVGIWGLQGLA